MPASRSSKSGGRPSINKHKAVLSVDVDFGCLSNAQNMCIGICCVIERHNSCCSPA